MIRRSVDLLSMFVILAGLVGLGIQLTRRQSVYSEQGPVGLPVEMSQAEFSNLAAGGHWIGPKDAPVLAVVFSDYLCSFCATLNESLMRLRSRYPQHFAIVVKQYVDPASISDVHLAAECAGELGMFEPFHRAAFSNQRVLGYSGGALTVAESAHIPDPEAFGLCIRSQRYIGTVETHWEEAKKVGVRATPTLFLDGIPVVGAAPLEVLDSLVQSHLADRSGF